MRLRVSHLVVPRRVYDQVQPPSPSPPLSLYIGIVIIHAAEEQVTHACVPEWSPITLEIGYCAKNLSPQIPSDPTYKILILSTKEKEKKVSM